MQINGLVANPATTVYSDGTNPLPSLGKQGDVLTSRLHGRWYTANYRGQVFVGATPVAGVTLPANAANLVSVFSLWNPAGSGVNAELIDLDVFMLNATEVVAAIALVSQSGVGSSVAVPGTLTKVVPNPGNLGNTPGSNKVGFYSALTHVGTPVVLKYLGGFQATAAGQQRPHVDFDGTVIVGPGSVVSLISTTVQTQAAAVSLTWAESPTP